jgi:hypothetical protein
VEDGRLVRVYGVVSATPLPKGSPFMVTSQWMKRVTIGGRQEVTNTIIRKGW